MFLKDNYNSPFFSEIILIIGFTGIIAYLLRNELKDNLFPLIFFILIFLIAIFGIYFIHSKYITVFPDFWPNGEYSNRTDWGTLGDYFGGVLNPFFSFLSLLLFLITIIIHLYELRKTRKEIRKSTKIQKKLAKHQKIVAKTQDKVTQIQNISSQIENRKTSFYTTKNSVIVRIPIVINNIVTDKLINYPHSFKFIFDVFRGKNDNSYQNNYFTQKKSYQTFSNFNNEILEKYGITLENYISAFFSLLNHIDYLYVNAESSHIKNLVAIYVDDLRDNLTPYEAAIIFYAPINHNNLWKELLEKYRMLKILVYKENIVPNEHRIYYKLSAFDSYKFSRF